MNPIKKVFQYGAHEVTLETGLVARQATGSVMVSMGETVLLVAVVAKPTADHGRDFFPLTVNYQEKTYAAGKIPGGFLKREGRPSEVETLTCRLIDRPLRPLFPAGFKNEVQIVATVMSLDPHISPDIPAIFGAAAALAISGVPFAGPVAAARVGYRDGEYLLNPSPHELDDSALNLVVAGTEKAVLMVESEAKELSEEVMLNAVLFGHQQMQVVIQAIKELADEAGKPAWDWQPPPVNTELVQKVETAALQDLQSAYQIQEKMQRYTKLGEIRERLVADVAAEDGPSESEVVNTMHDIEKKILRGRIMSGELRIDGRDTRTVRPISINIGCLPRTHGSVIFTRGETQAIVIATLGTNRDSQIIDGLTGESRDTFMLHYNFPPFFFK